MKAYTAKRSVSRPQPWARRTLATALVGGIVVLAGRCAPCSLALQPPPEAEQQVANEHITQGAIRGGIRFLADDLLEGRQPGSTGDRLTQLYLSTQFQGMGLEPILPDGEWLQPVPLVGVTTQAPEQLVFRHVSGELAVPWHSGYIATVGRQASQTSLAAAEVVFVGYGIVAPEYDWDDYKGQDLRGKILLMMNNDPADDPQLFGGKRRLYYGRWDYKYEIAAKQGAAGAIIIHTTPSAGYPFSVVQTSWSGEEFQLAGAADGPLEMRGWVTDEVARQLVALSGADLDRLREAAERRDFQPVSLGTTLTASFAAQTRQLETANVLGWLPGSDPDLAQECVVFMAHHDHLGMAESRDASGNNIYNGAIDNASGTASLLAIARACAALPTAPRRSLLFAAVAAEEQGLLGSKYLAQHPPLPAGRMAAVVNIDGMNFLGPTRDVNVIGLGKSSMDALVERFATWQQRVVTPDLFPDRGYFYRSDQFSMAKIGVPAVYLHAGIDVRGKPAGWGREQLDRWTETDYHQTSDIYRPEWDLRGAVEDVQLLMYVGLAAANADQRPAWKPGDEFEAARQQALADLPLELPH